MDNKRLIVLGEVNKQFIVSPDIDSLLEAMQQKEEPNEPLFGGAEQHIGMDTA
jgi:DNA-directed RNA polymerase III subunit RPC4